MKYTRSSALFANAEHVIPGGVNSPVRAFKAVGGTPLFIKEAKGADIRALVVDGQVVGAMKRQGKEGEFRSNLHRGGSANIIKLDPAELKLAINAAAALKLPVCGVDMLQSSRGPLLLEVNSTPGLEGIEGATGKNIAKNIITFIERNAKK